MSTRYLRILALLAGAAPLQAQTRTPPPPPPEPAPADAEAPAPEEEGPLDEEEEEDGETIVVTGQRQRGAVIGDIPPEVTLNRRDIRALGAGSLSELLEAIGPQTRSTRGDGPPVVLLNGRRISGFSEIRDIPPEAIVRVDVLPEEVALKYGYRADQRVVNFVLRRRFRAYTGELEGGLATAGGRPSYEADVDHLRISGKGRFNLSTEYQRQGALTEAERDIIQAEPVDGIELGRFRTLMPETERASINATVNRMLPNTVSATLNARLDVSESESLLGLPRPSLSPPALGRETDSNTAHVGLAVNGLVQPWQWSVTGNYDRTKSQTLTDTNIGSDRSDTLSQTGNLELVASGPVIELPGGEATASVRTGFDARSLDSETVRAGLVTARELSRGRGAGQVNLDVPIASRRRAFLDDIGNLSASFNAEIEHFSDFGTLRTLGGGLNWSPIDEVSLRVSYTDEDGAPSMEQLGNPVLVTPGVRVFDFVRGETVEATRIDGGNPGLIADNRRVWSLGANVRPPIGKRLDFNVSANYTSTRVENPISGFPAATAEIEAAFPERFQRDTGGRLVGIDTRPVNFARSKRSELRWGVNLGIPLGPPPPQRGPGGPGGRFRQGGGQGGAGAPGGRRRGAGQPTAPGTAAQPAPGTQPAPGAQPVPTGQPAPGPEQRGGGQRGPGGGRGGFGGGGFRFGGGPGGFGGFGGGRIQLSLYHTWRFEDLVLIWSGLPELDFLDGSAAGSGGGRPRHELEFQGGLFKNGLGARLTANWRSATSVIGGPVAGGGTASDLFFDDFITVNLRLFADLGQQSFAREHSFLRGMRVSLAVDNLLDSRQRVRDVLGATPIGYQPAYLDPLGRSVRLSLRKLFF